MKKLFLITTLLVTIFTSCSNDIENDKGTNLDQSLIPKSNLIEVNTGAFLPDSLIQSLTINNPDLYTFDNPNSDLWIDETANTTRSAGVTYKVYGYDEVRYVNDWKFKFAEGSVPKDSRVYGYTNMIFIGNIRLYVKFVRIPKGATFVLPPQSVMESLPAMGRLPIGTATNKAITTGYTHKQYSSTSTEDIYELVTEAVTVQYNVEGKQIFYNPPYYMPLKAIPGPSNFEFKYQYIFTSWD